MVAQLSERVKPTIYDVDDELFVISRFIDALTVVLDDLEDETDNNFIGIKELCVNDLYNSKHKALDKIEAHIALMKCSTKEAKRAIDGITNLL